MTDALEQARQTLQGAGKGTPKRFTIATLVNNRTHYDEMLASFAEGGFDRRDCEFLFVDNTGPEQTCAYRGLDRMLAEARGDYVILCHQDVRIVDDGRHELEARLAELETKDPTWAVAGNAGGVAPGRLALRISDPHGTNRRVGALPAKVMSLDENFLVVKRSARLSFSRDLTGFHFYGTDICLVADVLGFSTYVIDFHLEHLSGGNKGASFAAMEDAFTAKWARAFRPRFVQTTCSLISLTGDSLSRMIGRVAGPPLARISKHLPSAAGWTSRSSLMPANATTSNPPALPTGRRLSRRLGQQGALLFSGFALAQLCSFARNALVGYWLSRGDFGIAATITIALQMLETLSDLGADRLLVQAADGDDPRLMAAAHATLLARGFVTAAVLYLSAGAIVNFFDIAGARSAFELAALVPLIKSAMHLDSRRQQRNLQNRNYLVVEVVPQAAAVAAIIPCLYLTHDYSAVVWVSILQALLSVVSSQMLANRPYEIGFETAFLKRLIAFGWPIWLSAFPLVVVYQGDRVIVGRLLGMDALAGYSAAFMVAMVPGLLAAKVAHALFLPLLSDVRSDRKAFFQRYLLMFEGTSIAAAAYVVAFVIAGGDVMPLAFGRNYAGLDHVIGCLALMWALRMVQSICGMVLMAQGETRPLLNAGIIRASALVLAWLAVVLDLGLVGVAAAGVIGEFIAITYVLTRAAKGAPGMARATILRTLYPVAAGAVAAACVAIWQIAGNILVSLPVAMVLVASASLAGMAVMPGIRVFIEAQMGDAPAEPPVDQPNRREDDYAASRA